MNISVEISSKELSSFLTDEDKKVLNIIEKIDHTYSPEKVNAALNNELIEKRGLRNIILYRTALEMYRNRKETKALKVLEYIKKITDKELDNAIDKLKYRIYNRKKNYQKTSAFLKYFLKDLSPNTSAYFRDYYSLIRLYEKNKQTKELKVNLKKFVEEYVKYGKSILSSSQANKIFTLYQKHLDWKNDLETLIEFLFINSFYTKSLNILEKNKIKDHQLWVAQLTYKKGDYDKSKDMFKNLLNIEDYRDEGLLYLARIYRKQNKWSWAIKYYDTYVREFPYNAKSSEILWAVGWLYEEHGFYYRAIEYYKKVLEKYPDYKRADESLWRIGFMYYLLDKKTEMESYWKEIHKKFPDNQYFRAHAEFWFSKFIEEKKESAERHYNNFKNYPYTYYGMRSGIESGMPIDSLKNHFVFISEDSLKTVLQNSKLFKDKDWNNFVVISEIDKDLAEFEFSILRRRYSNEDDYLLISAYVYYLLKNYNRAIYYSRIFISSQQDIKNPIIPVTAYPLPEYMVINTLKDSIIAYAIAREESHFQPEVISHAGAIGVMQLMVGTAQRTAKKMGIRGFSRSKLFDPSYNSNIGSYHLQELIDNYNGEWEYAVGAYNAGKHNINEWFENPNFDMTDKDIALETFVFDETRYYIKRVWKSYWMYKILYNLY